MVRVEDLPDYVPNAFIAIEDRRFRSIIWASIPSA